MCHIKRRYSSELKYYLVPTLSVYLFTYTGGLPYAHFLSFVCLFSSLAYIFNIVGDWKCSGGMHIYQFRNIHWLRLEPHQWNSSVLTLDQVIKFVMSFASEVELGALFITSQEMVAIRNTLEEMKWPQPKSPIQTDNTAAAGVVNNTISPIKIKTMNHRLHWLRYREAQVQFRFYWASGSLKWGDYSTKHHSPLYQESKIMRFVGNQDSIKDIRYQWGSLKGVLFQVPGGTYFHLEP